jgi:hypothetical protein
MVRSPSDAPALRELVEVLDRPGVAAPAPPAPPAAPAAPVPADRVRLLEDELSALGEELKKLRAGAGS